jgi:type III secretion protein V
VGKIISARGEKVRDLFVPVGIIGILISMVVPLSSGVLDILLITNLIGALFLLLMTISVAEPLKLSALPTILLLTTLCRLALNISTTRLILGAGDAGEAVEAFGEIVIEGNLVVGAVIFLVITLIQFIVIAKGSERVAEVSARFTLDALPGKQMSIDADVRAGLLDIEGARIKRQELQIESRFYGALDGAMKFIKGDAIAGLLITAINIVGGFILGVTTRGLTVSEALSNYTVLTVGDGLLSQIPALLNALSAGMIVTRVTRGDGVPLSRELVQQLGQLRGVKLIIAVVSFLLGAVPEMPKVPFFALGTALLMSALLRSDEGEGEGVVARPSFDPKIPPLWKIVVKEPIGEGETLKIRLDRARTEAYDQMGILIPPPALSIDTELSHGWEIQLRGIQIASGDGVEELGDKFGKAILVHGTECIDDIFTRRLLDFFDRDAPELVSNVVPGVATVTQLTEVLRELVREGISVRNFDTILQGVAESSGRSLGERGLLQEVRLALRRVISSAFAREGGIVEAMTLDPLLDLSFAQVERDQTPLDLELVGELCRAAKGHFDLPVITSKGARATVRDCLRAKGLKNPVLAYEEIVEEVKVRSRHHLELKDEAVTGRVIDALAA